ncbi:MAG: hypothetical protein R2879_03320 [Saprospiraceae bacterium]
MERNLKILNWNFKISIGENRAILITCIGIALVFWLFIKLSKTYTTDYSFSIQYELSEDLAFVENPPQKLFATIEGRGWDLLFISLFGKEKKLDFYVNDINLSGINRSDILNKITTWLDNPIFKILTISFDNIPFELEKLQRKKVPVVAEIDLKTSPNYAVSGQIKTSPDSIELIGAPSILELYKSWPTTLKRLDNLKNTWSGEIELKSPEQEVLTISPKKVKIEIPVEAITEKSLFIPIVPLNPPKDSFSLFPKQVRVTFTVGVSAYQNISKKDFKAVVDYAQHNDGEKSSGIPISFPKLPEEITLINYTPKTAEVLVILD